MNTAVLRRPPAHSAGLVVAVSGCALAALGFTTLSAEFTSFSRPPGPALAVDVVAGVLSLALLPLLRREPVRVALVLSVLLTVSASATPAAGTATLWVARRHRLPAAVGVAAVGIAGHLVRAFWRPVPGRPLLLWLVVLAASYAAIIGWGAQAQARGALLASLRDRARRAEEEQAHRVAEARRAERTRIAREMHDVLAHRLSLLATYAGAIEFRPDAPPDELARAGGVIRAGAHQALEELREVIGVLREEPGEDPDDRAHPQPTLADLPRLLAESRAAGTEVTLDDRLAPGAAVPSATGRTVYRMVQEALTNARKHAAGQPVTVLLAGTAGRRLVVVVTNRTAAPPADPVPGSGTGLIGLRERVQLAGGRLGVRTGRGRFRIWAVLPWTA